MALQIPQKAVDEESGALYIGRNVKELKTFMRVPIAREALKLVFPLALLTVILFRVNLVLFALSLTFLILTLLFFRDPRRESPRDPRQIVSPADGTILQVRQVQQGNQLWNLVSIFMSPFNVHINYAPIEGRVLEVSHRRGSFLRADHEEASSRNESNTLVIQGGKIEVVMKQVAGVLARRIVCYCKKGDPLKLGQKIGLIQFGSRVDLYLPLSIQLRVKSGDKVKGTQSVLGVMG